MKLISFYLDNLKSYNSSCSSNSSCDSTKSLYCVQIGQLVGLCACNSLMYWNGSTCAAEQTINTTCSSTSQCRMDLGLSCISAICSCNSNYYWSGSACGMKFLLFK